MRIAFLNPQGNFDPGDSYWTAHPDFGGQLVYVKNVAMALAAQGHTVDIITRRIRDAEWPEFAACSAAYPEQPGVRIVRLPCGGDRFLRKEDLWPHLGGEWVDRIVEHYAELGEVPGAATAHYADGGLAAAIWHRRGGPSFTFTGHSLGAQKLDRLLNESGSDLAALERQYHFSIRLAAERVSMSHAGRIVTSTRQERFEQYGHGAYRGAVSPEDDSLFSVIPPGVNLSVFGSRLQGPDDERISAYVEARLARDLAPARLELPAVISSSRLEPKKNHLGLVRAFATSGELRTAANLILVVRGAEDIRTREGFSADEREILDGLAAIVDGNGLEGGISVFSLESQAELAAAYRHLARRRSAFALTAHYEPFGLAPLEAMAAGLPAVVTRNGGPSESLVEDNERFGVLVDPESPEDIARGLLEIVGRSSDWQTWHEAGQRRVLARYTWDRTAEGYAEAIRTLRAARDSRDASTLPAFFRDPRPENAPGVESLEEVFGRPARGGES